MNEAIRLILNVPGFPSQLFIAGSIMCLLFKVSVHVTDEYDILLYKKYYSLFV